VIKLHISIVLEYIRLRLGIDVRSILSINFGDFPFLPYVNGFTSIQQISSEHFANFNNCTVILYPYCFKIGFKRVLPFDLIEILKSLNTSKL